MGLNVELLEQRFTLGARHIGDGMKPVSEGTGATSSFYVMVEQPGPAGLPLSSGLQSTHPAALRSPCGQAPAMWSHVRR